MSENNIFNNYHDKCPNCGGELDSNHRFCPFCGQNLEDLNVKYRDNEAVIADAIEDIDEAKRRLEHRETQLVSNKKKSVVSKILKWGLILFGGYVVFMLLCAIGFSIYEVGINNQIDELKSELRGQNVDTVEIDAAEIDSVEFVDTNMKAAVGYIQESDDVLKIPFFCDGGYSNEGVFEGNIYLSKDGLEKISRFDDYSATFYYENMYIYLRQENSQYYDDAIDSLTIYDDNINSVKRLDNIQVGDVIFECYLIDDEYHFIANPYHDCFIFFEVDTDKYDDISVSVEEAFKILRIDAEFSLGG